MSCQNLSPPLGLAYGNITVANGVVSRGIGLGVGAPLQVIAVSPSTADQHVWVYNADDCVSDTDAYCTGEHGGVYNSTKSRSYKQTTRQDWNGTGLDSDTTDTANQRIYFNENIQYGTNGTTYGFPMVMRKLGDNVGSGLGLGYNSTFLQQAVASGSAPTRAFGMWVGSQSVTQPLNGAMWIGGYDQSRVAGQFTNFSSNSRCATCAIVTGFDYQYGSTTVSLFSNSSQTMHIAIEPYSDYLNVPPDIYANLMKATQTQGTYSASINSILTYNRNAQMGNLSVTLQTDSGSYKTVIPASELFFPPRDIDQNTGQLYISNNSFLIGAVVNKTDDGNVLDWGIPFLTMNYMVVDYDNSVFRLAAARQGPYSQSEGALVQPLCKGLDPKSQTMPGLQPGTNGTNSTGSGSDSGQHHTPVGAIAGGVVGGVVGLAIIGALIWFLLRGKRNEKKLKQERDAALANGSEAGTNQDRMSHWTGNHPPTEVSEIYSGDKTYPQNNVNTWLHNQPQGQSDPIPVSSEHSYPTQPHSPPPTTTTYTANSHTSPSIAGAHASSNMNEPFEMPAYQYR